MFAQHYLFPFCLASTLIVNPRLGLGHTYTCVTPESKSLTNFMNKQTWSDQAQDNHGFIIKIWRKDIYIH
jgi:hypothetical protein